MSTYPEIYVIRHGQTQWNTETRHQGRKDSPLTELGKAQASAIGEALVEELRVRPEMRAYASPQGRVQASASLMLAGLPIEPTNDPRLQEIGFGIWEGLTWDDIAAGWPEKAAIAENDPFLWHFQAPGGESLAEITDRCRAFLEDLTGPSIILTHGVTSRVLRGIWLGLTENDLAGLPGGQGVIYHLAPGQEQRVIRAHP